MSSTFTPSGSAALAPDPSDVPEPRPAASPAGAAGGADSPRRVPPGDELPLFCEQCGYALHGLPQSRCDHCRILHFACPECGHHQPINTLRPAIQRDLATLRCLVLGLWAAVKVSFFVWLLIAWFAVGKARSYLGRHFPVGPFGADGVPQSWAYHLTPRPLDADAIVSVALLGFGFGLLGRMLLLRWRRDWVVGLGLAALMLLAVGLGAYDQWARLKGRAAVIEPLGGDFHLLAAWAALAVVLGAAVAWPLWRAVAHLLLPPATARAMLEWQQPDAAARAAA